MNVIDTSESNVTNTKEFRLKYENKRLGRKEIWEAIADLMYIIENLESRLEK